MPRTPLRRAAALAATALAAAGLAACQSAGAATSAEPTRVPAAVEETVASPVVDVSPSDGAVDVRPDEAVEVRVAHGTVVDVVVLPAETAGEAMPVEGTAEGDGWTSSVRLDPSTAYDVVVTVADAAGQRSEHRSTFATLTPESTTDAYVVPGDGWTVGVGMPVVVDFDVAVGDRAAVERALAVESTPAVDGAWSWFSDRQVQWRPRELWPSGTTATLRADLSSVEIADGTWGARDREVTFEVGSAMVSTVDHDTLTMTVRRDGEVLRTIPVTTGKRGFETRNGTKVVMSRHSEYAMDAATTGISPDDPEYYDVTVDYAMRLTYSGEFIHAAPWSASQHGRSDASHGCTGMSTEDARWLFESSKVGDVVEFVGFDRPLERGNGYTAWETPFAEWAAGSALGG